MKRGIFIFVMIIAIFMVVSCVPKGPAIDQKQAERIALLEAYHFLYGYEHIKVASDVFFEKQMYYKPTGKKLDIWVVDVRLTEYKDDYGIRFRIDAQSGKVIERNDGPSKAVPNIREALFNSKFNPVVSKEDALGKALSYAHERYGGTWALKQSIMPVDQNYWLVRIHKNVTLDDPHDLELAVDIHTGKIADARPCCPFTKPPIYTPVPGSSYS